MSLLERFFAIALCAGLAAEAVSAQVSMPPMIEAQPLTFSRGGAVQGCGLRLTVAQPGRPASSWFDVSLNVFQRGIGVAQSIAYEIRRSELEGDSRPSRLPVQRTWVKTQTGNARMGENSDRSDSLVYRMLLEDVLVLFEAVATAQPVTLGVRPWGQREDQVFTGTAAISDDSRQAMSACLQALAK